MDFKDREFYKNKIGIYAIRNKINKKVYVGQTGQNFLRRYLHHCWKLKNNCHDNRYLQNAYNKCGEGNFEFVVLSTVDDKSLLDDLEIKYIQIYEDRGISYNMLEGGGGRRGFTMSEHTKELIGHKNSIHMTGKKMSDETKRKMSETRSGQDYTIYRKTTILSDDIVYEIKQRLTNGETASSISKELDIDYKLINNLIANNTWKHIKVDGWDDYLKTRKTYSRLSKEDHLEIYRLHVENGLSKYELSEMYGKGVKMIEKIFRDQKKIHDNPVPSSK